MRALQVALPKTGFALGENVPLDVQIDNQSHRNIVRVECCLIQRATFAATSPQLAIEKRDESRFVTTWREAFKVKKRSSAAYCRTLKIPTGGCVPTFSVVQLLQVDYTLGVRLENVGSRAKAEFTGAACYQRRSKRRALRRVADNHRLAADHCRLAANWHAYRSAAVVCSRRLRTTATVSTTMR